MFRIVFLIMAALTLSSQVSLAASLHDKPLKLGFMPYLNAQTLIEKYTPLAHYLSDKVGRHVEVTVAKNYAEHIRLTGDDKLDIAFLGGSPYVVIDERYGKKPLLVRYEFDNKPTFRSVIFVAKNSPFRRLDDLKNKRIAFGSKKSTLSTQVPAYMLLKAGVNLSDLKSFKHLRNHENVLLGVEFGDFDAGAIAEEVYQEHKEKHKLRALAFSDELSTHVFVARADLSEKICVDIRQALLDLKSSPQANTILTTIGANLTGFVSVKDSDYDAHREILNQVLPLLEQ